MIISIQADLLYSAAQPCDLLLQIEAAEDTQQRCFDTRMIFDPDVTQHVVAGEDGIGTRRWMRAGQQFGCHYETRVEITRPATLMDQLLASELTGTPSEVTKYLMPSRYCHPEAFFDFVPGQFGHLSGGALVVAMSDWLAAHFTYDITASHAGTTATDSFHKRAGVCRDYAHVLIAMARATSIPARFVSAYAPNVQPQDFHAVVEVYLDGDWHLIDPTGMAQASDIVRIGVGRDAADVSFMTSYGLIALKKQTVDVVRVG